MAASNDEQDIAQQLFGYRAQDAIPDHPPVLLVPDNAPMYKVQVLVPNRPGYIGGSGPPIMELLPQAPYHYSRFEILDCVDDEEGKQTYVLYEKNHPENRIRVEPQDILTYVSQRTVEAYSCIDYAKFEDRKKEEDIIKKEEDKQGEQEKTTARNKRGRPKKRGENEEVELDETVYNEVIPAKKNRALYVSRWEREEQQQQPSETDAVPSLSQPSLSQPSLSQQGPSMKRKLSKLFSKESTPGETTDDFIEDIEVPQPRKLSIRENGPNSPKLYKSAIVAEERPARSAPSVEIPPKSPFRKQPSSPAPSQQMSPPGTSASSATKIVPGTPRPLFPIFGSRTPAASSEQPRSTSKIQPPERKRPALPASSRSFDK